MKIWIDARSFSLKEKKFFIEFIKNLKDYNSWDIFNIYWSDLPKINNPQIKIVESKKYINFLSEQTFFLKKLIEDKNDIIINFDETFPIFYNNKIVKIVNSMEKILYPDINNSKFFKKYSFLTTFKINLKKAEKIICFHNKTKEEINEKLNVDENKIYVINSFFYKLKQNESLINIKNKYLLKWDYFIYNSWIWNSKNLKKFLEAFLEVLEINKNLTLFITWNETSKDIELRELIIDLWLTNNIIFTWDLIENEIKSFYNQASFIIHPVIYDAFWISLNQAINYNTKILASKLIEIQSIFWDNIYYFNPLYKNEIKNAILNNLENKKNIDYSKIIEKYNSTDFVKNLLNTL